MSTTTLVFAPPCAFINANDRTHYRAKAKLTQAWREAAHVRGREVLDPRARDAGRATYQRARITIAYRFPTNRRREVSNLQPTSKALVDGLVDAGLIPDDDDTHLIGPDNRREYPNGPPRVTITIRELPQ